MRKKHIIFFGVMLMAFYLISIKYLFVMLTPKEIKVKSVEDKIVEYLKVLPDFYKTATKLESDVFEIFLKNLNSISKTDVRYIWDRTKSWISQHQLVNSNDVILGSVIKALKETKIIKADLDTRGSQLKFLLTLEGSQQVVFKPKWYNIDTIIHGPVYAGKDRFHSEIVGFYLSIVLNLPYAPVSVYRGISFRNELVPVATPRLLATSYVKSNRTCIYGACFYCKPQDPICEDENYTVYGTVIYNVNAPIKSYRSPWQRSYKKNKKKQWEEDGNYCKFVKPKISQRYLLDIIDTSIFDFLIQNGDRHHFETIENRIVLLDNGKGFGNPNLSHIDILAPLYQCCILRNSTFSKLLNVAGGEMRRKLEALPDINNLLTFAHFKGLEERLLIIFATIEYCKYKNKSIFVYNKDFNEFY